MDNIFYRTLLNDKVKIEPKFLGKDFRMYLLKKLQRTVEGICTKHGFVRCGSIELYKVSPGNIDLVGLNGYILFDVFYWADVCNPLIGNVVKAKVMNVNKFGILADVMGILEIIVAKNSVSISHESNVDIEKIKIGDVIMVEIVGKKFELQDKKISIIGRIVSDVKNVQTKKREDKEKVEEYDDNDDVIQEYGDVIETMSGGTGGDLSEVESEDQEEDDASSALDDIDQEDEGTANGFFESDESDDPVNEDFYDDVEESEAGDSIDGGSEDF
jgi:DNA-directed RNA polymerase subunit E'/Rpb7